MSLYLETLIDHVLVGEGRDHELNADIHAAFGLPFEMEYPTESHTTPVPNRSMVPCYTSSVEAVMALVAGTLPNHGCAFDARPGRMALGWVDDVPDGDPRIPSIAKTAARAMLAAAVRARIALEDRE